MCPRLARERTGVGSITPRSALVRNPPIGSDCAIQRTQVDVTKPPTEARMGNSPAGGSGR
eukprot:1118868-Prorocentrum_minimum.AAC.1